MVGIVLNEERVRKAPAHVRRWLRDELASTLGLSLEADSALLQSEHLAACNPQQAMAIYNAIRRLPLTSNVFFELGREADNLAQEGVVVLQVEDILQHTRLQNNSQLLACFNAIHDVFHRVICDPHASICVMDERGYCFISFETQQSIANVWNTVLAEHWLPDDVVRQMNGGRDLGSPDVLKEQTHQPRRFADAASGAAPLV